MWKIHDIAKSNDGEYMTVFVMRVTGQDEEGRDDGPVYKARVLVKDPDDNRRLLTRVKAVLKAEVLKKKAVDTEETSLRSGLSDLSFLDQ